MRKSHLGACLLAATFLSGCIASAPVIDAEAVKNDGLLIGEFTSIPAGSVLLADDATISGEVHRYAIQGNTIRLPLKPGTYELEQLSHSSSYSTGTSRVTSLTRYPVRAKFTIRAGEVTNLGKLVLYFPVRGGKKYTAFFVKNDDDMQAFLRTEHPSAYNALRSKQFHNADVTYADDKQIEALRTMSVSQFAQSEDQYLAGDLGAVAKVVRNKQGKIAKLQFFETGTYQKVGPCNNANGRFVCVVPHPTKGNRLYVGGKNGLNTHEMPVSGKNYELKLVGDRDIVLVNQSMEVHTSTDDGRSWSTYTASRLEKPLQYSERPGFSVGRQGYYVFSKGDDATILYRKYGAPPSYQVVAPPKRGENLYRLTETDKGLYAGPEFTLFGDASVFFKANGQNTWAKHVIPSSNCGEFEVIDRAKDRIATKCSNKYFVTNDQGKTWREALRSELRSDSRH